MNDGADIVILSQREECDPRNDETRATVRVVLHRCAGRVLVDIARGADATGAPLPVRLDPHALGAALDDIRGAYSFLERTIGEWYERAIAAERRATEAESRAQRAESRPRAGYIGPALPTADPRTAARRQAEQLLALAANSHSENEARNAAMSAAKLIREHSLLVK